MAYMENPWKIHGQIEPVSHSVISPFQDFETYCAVHGEGIAPWHAVRERRWG